jgi:uncharacterized membrane protein YgdD (TMEM256/DUF423 family)
MQILLLSHNLQTIDMTKRYLITVSVLGIWGIIMGFLYVQLFSGDLSSGNQGKYLTGLVFHLLHTVALLSITFMNRYVSRSNLDIVYYLFTLGIVAFSGALYVTSTEELTNIILGFMKLFIPVGTLLLIAGWMILLFTGVTYKHKKRAIHNA